MSYSSMLTSVSIPFGSPGSILQDPNATAQAASASFQANMGSLFDPGDPALTAASTLTASTTTYTNTKMGKLMSELPILNAAQAAQDRVKQIDSLAAGTPPNITDATDAAFPKSATSGCSGTSSVGSGFAALTSGVKSALSGVTTAFSSALFGNPTTKAAAIASIPGIPPSPTQAQFEAALAAANPAQLAAMKASAELASPGVFATVGSTVSGAIASVSSTFDAAKTAADNAVKSAFATLTGGNFLGMMNSTNPCVQSLLTDAVNPAQVDSRALGVSSMPASTINAPAVVATQQVQAGNRLQERAIVPTNKVPTPPASTADLYTNAELAGFKAMLASAYYDPLQQMKADAAAWVKTNVEDWKASVNYQQKQTAAGATVAVPGGTSTVQADLDAWNAVYQSYIPKRDYYNNTLLPPIKAAEATYKAAYYEYGLRSTYGKHPYTTCAAQGVTIKVESQTTLLDSGI